MKWRQKQLLPALGILVCTATAMATDLTIHLSGSKPIPRQRVTFACDASGVSMGLPSRSFSVEYLNDGGNSLAIVPISGDLVIFANVVSASGARYASGAFIWWDAGSRGTNLYSDSLAGKHQSSCHRLRAN